MRAHLTSDPAANAADALFQHVLDSYVTTPDAASKKSLEGCGARRRKTRWCATVAVISVVAADVISCRAFGRCGLLRSVAGGDAARVPPAPGIECADKEARHKRCHRRCWPFVILSAPKSGTTWFRKMLASHPNFASRGEQLLDFSREGANPAWGAVEERLDAALADAPVNSRPGFVLMYDHLPQGSHDRFAAWCFCNGVSVIHLIRSSALESFWTLQAEVRDVVDLGKDYVDSSPVDLSARLRSNRRAIALDAQRARAYVTNVEASRGAYRDALKYSRPVEYMEVFYEDLIRDPGSLTRRLGAVQAFLGVPLHDLNAYATRRMHPGNCREKIANWGAVARACRGTEAVKACL